MPARHEPAPDARLTSAAPDIRAVPGAEPGMAAREDLAARQLALVRALVAGAAPPVGVAQDRVAIQAAALRRKRARTAAKHQPELAAALGAGFWPAFEDYLRAQPGPPHCPACDAHAFARYLCAPAGHPHVTREIRRAARRAVHRRHRLLS